MAKAKLDLDTVTMVLVLIGALNIGLIVVGVDVLAKIPGVSATIVNAAIGLSAVLIAYKKFVK